MSLRDEIGQPKVSNVARFTTSGTLIELLPAPGTGYSYFGVKVAYDASTLTNARLLVGEDDLTEGTDQIYLDVKQVGQGQVEYDWAEQTAANKAINAKLTAVGDAWVKVEARKKRTGA
jgi:hypothetical protein